MRAYVFTDRALERHAGRFVWLSIDAEKEVNAGFLEKYPIVGFPTFLVIDPEKETAAFRQLGGFPVSAFARLLDDGEKALRSGGSDPDSIVAEGDRLRAADKDAEAADAYRKALDSAPAGWEKRERVLESFLDALSSSERYQECLDTARAALPDSSGMHHATLAAYGLDCGLSLEGEAKTKAVAEFEPMVKAVVADRSLAMTGDDRSSLYLYLWGAREDAKDAEGAKRVASEWLDYLDAEAAKAPNARARAVFDSHRLMAALESGKPERAIAFLIESEKSLPDDYNPPARLAVAYKEAGKLDEALAAADRALALAYGPRKLRVYSTKADILEEDGKIDAAKATMEEAIRYAEGLPKSQVHERTVASLKLKLAKIGTKPPVG